MITHIPFHYIFSKSFHCSVHNCRFTLICKIAPSSLQLTISLTTSFGMESSLQYISSTTSVFSECPCLYFSYHPTTTTFLSFWGPIDKKQLWFFQCQYQTQPTCWAPPHYILSSHVSSQIQYNCHCRAVPSCVHIPHLPGRLWGPALGWFAAVTLQGTPKYLLSYFSTRLSSFFSNFETPKEGLCKQHAKHSWAYLSDSSGHTCLTCSYFQTRAYTNR